MNAKTTNENEPVAYRVEVENFPVERWFCKTCRKASWPEKPDHCPDCGATEIRRAGGATTLKGRKTGIIESPRIHAILISTRYGRRSALEAAEKLLANDPDAKRARKNGFEPAIVSVKRQPRILLRRGRRRKSLARASAKTARPCPLLDEYEWSVRASTIIEKLGLATFADLCSYSPRDLLRIRNCGRETIKEFKKALAEHGLRFMSQG